MKKLFKKFYVYVLMLLLCFFITDCDKVEVSVQKKIITYKQEDSLIKISKKELLKMNSYFESRCKWNVANKYGYVGKYQIGKLTLIDLGYDINWVNSIQKTIYFISDTIYRKKNGIVVDTNVRKFYYFDVSLFPPSKQEEVIHKLLNKNEKIYLKEHINVYVGKKISGVRITKAGILSASFLGIRYVDYFLKSNGKINPSDANGHSIKDRLKLFEKYEII
jgi:hypothetical protein